MASNKKDLAVIGTGKFGLAVVKQLVEMNRFVLAIDKDEEKITQASRITKAVIADGTDIEALKDLGISKFRTVIVGAAENNIEIVSALIELGVKHIIAKARSERHERVLAQIGVDIIVRPESEAGIRTALIATSPHFIKYSSSLQEIGDGYAIGSTIVSDEEWLGIAIKDLKFDGIKIVSAKRGTKVHLPDGNFQFKDGDVVTVIGKIQKITKAFLALNDTTRKTTVVRLEKSSKAIEKAHNKRSKRK